MQDHRCPNCDNDLSDSVMSAIVSRLRAGGKGPEPMACPHCSEPLQVTVAINATLSRQQLASTR